MSSNQWVKIGPILFLVMWVGNKYGACWRTIYFMKFHKMGVPQFFFMNSATFSHILLQDSHFTVNVILVFPATWQHGNLLCSLQLSYSFGTLLYVGIPLLAITWSILYTAPTSYEQFFSTFKRLCSTKKN